MKYLHVIDQAGNRHDYEGGFVPRIGERIKMMFGIGGAPVTDHYSRVKDVEYVFDNDREGRVAILIKEERDPLRWPSVRVDPGVLLSMGNPRDRLAGEVDKNGRQMRGVRRKTGSAVRSWAAGIGYVANAITVWIRDSYAKSGGNLSASQSYAWTVRRASEAPGTGGPIRNGRRVHAWRQ
jgi:hypothetical protein